MTEDPTRSDAEVTSSSGPAAGYEPVIGLEVHVQLKTEAKIFCSCSTAFGAPPNSQVCPVCMGFPGSLPVLNARAVEYAVKAAQALNCTVHTRSIFARKNYFYPDLPKGYQISQFDQPLATDGWIDLAPSAKGTLGAARAPEEPLVASHGDVRGSDVGTLSSGDDGGPEPWFASEIPGVLATNAGDAPEDAGRAAGARAAGAEMGAGEPGAGAEMAPGEAPDDGARCVRILRLHLEEDAGKSFHGTGENGATLLDFNRCGVPLIEIVSAPDIHSPAEAYLYLTRLKQVMHYLGVSDVNMEEGSLRCDANVSVRPAGTERLGTKTEVKNLNSFKNVEHALEFEIMRQIGELSAGRAVEHQTLLWDVARGAARPMRSKEMSHDYRYFPEPDLGPLLLDPVQVEEWKLSLPELPDVKQERLQAQYGIPAYDAGVLTATRQLADWFERAAAFFAQSPKEVSNWVMGEVLRVLNERQIEIDALALQPEQLAELLALKESGEVSGRMAKSIFEKMLESGKGPRQILEEDNLRQISDDSELRAICASVLEERPAEVEGYLGGRAQLLSFFIGEVMKKTRGRANPKAASDLLRGMLEERRGGGGVTVATAEPDVSSGSAEPALPSDSVGPAAPSSAASGGGLPARDAGAASPEAKATATDRLREGIDAPPGRTGPPPSAESVPEAEDGGSDRR